jgi:hypothetical protein
MGKPAGMVPPANQRRFEMTAHLIFLPLILVIIDVKVKIIRKPIIRKKRQGQGPARSRAGPPLVPSRVDGGCMVNMACQKTRCASTWT